MRIDSHQHFWKYNPVEYDWISDEMGALKRDHLPDELQQLAGSVGIDGSVAVQARQTLEETKWLLELAGQYPFIKGVVGWVDLRSEKVDEQLAEFAYDKKLKGVRHVVQSEPDDEFMMREEFLRGIDRLERYGLTYDILIFPKHLECAKRLVKKFPSQKFVVDHLAKPFIKKGLIQPWKQQMEELARHENVWCKLSGMVTEADWVNWKPSDLEPYIETVLEAFGPKRVMFGSDWPVCTAASRYERVFGVVRDYINDLEQDERDMVLGGTAVEFYGLLQ